MSQTARPLHVHVLVDLEWSSQSGGQVTCWQRLATAARDVPGLEITLHAQGNDGAAQIAPNVRLVLHKPVFSTRRIPFLHAPAHTDLASYHPGLARALEGADVIHTTDGFFAYAKTAERVAKTRNIPLVHSVHTDTVSYSRIFTRRFFEKSMGGLGTAMDDAFGISKNVANDMQRKLDQHEKQCRFVLVSREEDRASALKVTGPARVLNYRLGLDREMFTPDKRDRAAFHVRYNIPQNSIVVMFVGRIDEGKNIHRIIGGMERAIKNGAPLFLFAAGLGPAEKDIHARLKGHAATPGFLNEEDLSVAYAGADWLALPSTVETWSLVAEEALASGLPLIASCGSGVGRFLGSEGAGLLVREDSDKAWEAALMEACGLQDMDRLRSLARTAALAQFPDWSEALSNDFLPVWRMAAGR
jgi:glycosyltransferase involved in cell wall biosynthesis